MQGDIVDVGRPAHEGRTTRDPNLRKVMPERRPGTVKLTIGRQPLRYEEHEHQKRDNANREKI